MQIYELCGNGQSILFYMSFEIGHVFISHKVILPQNGYFNNLLITSAVD